MVYFVAAESGGCVKVGFTAGSVEDRLRQLQVGSPVPLIAIVAVKATRAVECWLHEELADDWSHGEWFRQTPRVRAIMEAAKMCDATELSVEDLRRIRDAARATSLFPAPPIPQARARLGVPAGVRRSRGQTKV